MKAGFWSIEGGSAPTRPQHQGIAAEAQGFRCGLCFRRCRLREGEIGFCGVRGVENGDFVSPLLGRFCSLAIDPIEKKPLYHWRPGTFILSLGSLGCTMSCPFCQNHSIAHPEGPVPLADIPPQALAAKAKEMGQSAVAYTYNEPTLQAEYIIQAAPLLEEAGAKTVLVTNAVMSSQAADDLSRVTAAANIDLKTFSPSRYAEMGGSLETVKNNVSLMLARGVHVELTTLVVPGISDDAEDFAALVEWAACLSPDIPLHISRYFPAYKYSAPMTGLDLMKRLSTIAAARLRHVHLGNVR